MLPVRTPCKDGMPERAWEQPSLPCRHAMCARRRCVGRGEQGRGATENATKAEGVDALAGSPMTWLTLDVKGPIKEVSRWPSSLSSVCRQA